VTPFAEGNVADVLSLAMDRAARGERPAGHWIVAESAKDRYPNLAAEIQRDKLSWISAIALEKALAQAGIAATDVAPERLGLSFGCALAGQLGMIEFANEVREQSARFVSPIHFPNTVGNYAAGALARAYGIRGPNITLACGAASGLAAIGEACSWLNAGVADVVIAGGADVVSSALATGMMNEHPVVSEGACLFVLESQSRATARGARPIGLILNFHNVPAIRPQGHLHFANVPPNLISCADRAIHGAISIESSVGYCLGALGAAAPAAALGALSGKDVPGSGNESGGSLIGRKSVADSQDGDKRLAYVVAADDAGNMRVMMVGV
jgi:3-oxoacyl-(acyl-carrier-protein) synthase